MVPFPSVQILVHVTIDLPERLTPRSDDLLRLGSLPPKQCRASLVGGFSISWFMSDNVITSPSESDGFNNVKGYASGIVIFNFLPVLALLPAIIENPEHLSLANL
jgi:hypothetical protein